MFTSPRPVVFMTCGHSIHKKCYDQHMSVSYKCPICNRSLANMETQFRNLDVAIQGQPMPAEFQDTKAIILCNDCSGRSTVPYHWLGLKCRICRSYNTVELQMLGGSGQEPQTAAAELASGDAPETGPQAADDAGQTADPPGAVAAPAGRRRHSSQAIEMPRRVSDLIAGSFPPLSTRLGPILAQFEVDSESEDGILGFWGGSADDDSSYVNGESDEDMSDSEEEDEDDEEDDDDDNEIMLIGHR